MAYTDGVFYVEIKSVNDLLEPSSQVIQIERKNTTDSSITKLISRINAISKYNISKESGAYPGIGQGGHFSKFSTRVAKMSISVSSAYSHGEMFIRMLLAYSVFL